MRTLFGIGLVALLALAGGCGQKAGTSGPGGPAGTGIEGDWTLVGFEAGGQKFTAEDLAQMPAEEKAFTATGDELITTKDGKKDPASYKIDKTKTPNEIDLTGTKKDGQPETLYGISKLEGDVLTICAAMSDKPTDRPKEFKTEPKKPVIMLTLRKK